MRLKATMTLLRTSVLVLVSVSIVCFTPASHAQVAPLIANVGARQTTNLDGQWRVIVDPYDVGYMDYRAKPITGNNAFFKDHKPQSPSELVEYDFDTSGQLNVPGDWNTQRDALLFYEGSLWYKRFFNYTKPTNKRLFVHFGAANYIANVYLNGEPLGLHGGGFTPFNFEITDCIRPQNNFLIARVNDKRSQEFHRQHRLVELWRHHSAGHPRRGSRNLHSGLLCSVGEGFHAPDCRMGSAQRPAGASKSHRPHPRSGICQNG
jgi:beta-glucuronidase